MNQETAKRRCAYCDRAGKLTREELFSKFLMSSYPSYQTYLDHRRAKRLHGAAPVVRDVCLKCNNELLAALDGYMTRLNRAYFSVEPPAGTVVSFEYDYHLLLRWLLKTWYNDARGSGLNVAEHRSFTSYILGRVGEPPCPVTILLGILPPFRASSQRPREFAKVIRFGTTTVENAEVAKDILLARLLSLNSYLFHLLVWYPGVARSGRRAFVRGLEEHWGFKELRRRDGKITLKMSRVDTLHYLMATSSSGGTLRKR